MPENAICMILNNILNEFENEEERGMFVAELIDYLSDDNVSKFVQDNIREFIENYYAPLNDNGEPDEALASERYRAFEKLLKPTKDVQTEVSDDDRNMAMVYETAKENIDEILKNVRAKKEEEKKQESVNQEGEKDGRKRTRKTEARLKKKSGTQKKKNESISKLGSNQSDRQTEEDIEKKSMEEELQKKKHTSSYDDSTHQVDSRKKAHMSIFERLMQWLNVHSMDGNFNELQIEDIYKFMNGLNQNRKNEKDDDRTKFNIKALRDDMLVTDTRDKIKKDLEKAKDMFLQLCNSEKDEISTDKFNHASAVKKKLKEFFETCYDYRNGEYELKGGNLDTITQMANDTALDLKNYLKEKKPNWLKKFVSTKGSKRYDTINQISDTLTNIAYRALKFETQVDWKSYSLESDGEFKKIDDVDERYKRWQKGENEKKAKRSPHVKKVKITNGKINKNKIINHFRDTVKNYNNEREEKSEDRLEEATKEANIRKKDAWKNLSQEEINKTRKANAEKEFYGGYEALLSIQDDQDQKLKALKLVNSNDPEVLKQWLEKIDKKADDTEVRKLQNYVKYRIDKLKEVNEVIKNAVKNMQNREVGQLQTNDENDGGITYKVDNVNQDEIQRTSNGCWSVALSTMLKHRGVKLDQSQIRAYRPDVDSFPNDIEFANQDKPNSIHAYTDLIQSVLPNTAVNCAHYSSCPNKENQLLDQDKQTELSKVADQMNKVITYAMQQGRGPVALLVGSHYHTIYELNDDKKGNVTVTFCDPYEFKPQKMTLKQLAEKSYTVGNEKQNENGTGTVVSNEKFEFEAQWLQDLKNDKGELDLGEDLREKIKYGEEGKLEIHNDINLLDRSDCHKHIALKSFSNECSCSTYLPVQLKDIQLKKSKVTSKEQTNFEQLNEEQKKEKQTNINLRPRSKSVSERSRISNPTEQKEQSL